MSTKSFGGAAQQYVDRSSLDFYLWERLKSVLYSALIEHEETRHQRSFYACQTICNRP